MTHANCDCTECQIREALERMTAERDRLYVQINEAVERNKGLVAEVERLRVENHENLGRQSERHEHETAMLKAQLKYIVEKATQLSAMQPMPPIVVEDSAELTRLRAVESAARAWFDMSLHSTAVYGAGAFSSILRAESPRGPGEGE